MTHLAEDQVYEIQEIFNIFDNRGDGKIYASQIGDVLRAIGLNPTMQEVDRCGYAKDPEARISFDTFLPIYHTMQKNAEPASVGDFVEGLRVFDKDGNGLMSCAELRHLLTTIGEKMSDEEVEQLTTQHEDSSGNINYEDFITTIMNG